MQKLLNKVFCCLFVLLFCYSFSVNAQVPDEDLKLILNKPDYSAVNKHPKIEYLFAGRSAFVKFNPLSLFFGGLMYFYQTTISPQFSATCLYVPSCSYFSKNAIREFGLIKGICLSADRLTRCSKLGLTDIHHHCFDEETGKVHENMDMFKIKQP